MESGIKKHFSLKYKDVKIPEREKPAVHGYFGESGLSKRRINEKFQEIVRDYEKKPRVYDDGRYYFILTFTIPTRSQKWSSVFESFSGNIAHVYNEKVIKLGIIKHELDKFIQNCLENRRYIKDITNKSNDKIISAKLQALKEEQIVDVAIKTIDLSGMNDPKVVEIKLNKSLETGETIHLGYHSKQKALFKARLKKSTINTIVENVETIVSIEKIPELTVDNDSQAQLENYLRVVKAPEKEAQVSGLPLICVVDSGINQKHEFLKNYIYDVFDYSQDISQKSNIDTYCRDETGHGSLVSSVAIYKGDFAKVGYPLAKVIMAKVIGDANKVLDIPAYPEKIALLNDVIDRFMEITRIFNFSFNSDDKISSWTELIDDIIYEKDVVVVVSAGNIREDKIIHSLNKGINYPRYIFDHNINFPGDCNNVITVGSFTTKESDLCGKQYPSPFTRCGIHSENIKPDTMANGGNLQPVLNKEGQVISLHKKDLGIKGASHRDCEIQEAVGTSFSSPLVSCVAANIYDFYRFCNPYLVKAMLISSTEQLNIKNVKKDESEILQGFGVPDLRLATQSLLRRCCFLLQGYFEYSKPKSFHRYSFYFPKNADKLTITFVIGKPSRSNSYIKYKLIRGGSSSYYTPTRKVVTGNPSNKISSTHKQTYDVSRAGKGEWIIDIIPEIPDVMLENNSLKYGCVITIESTQNKDVYTDISLRYETEATDRIQSKERQELLASQIPRISV